MAYFHISVIDDDKNTSRTLFQVNNPAARILIEALSKARTLMATETIARIMGSLEQMHDAKNLTDEEMNAIMAGTQPTPEPLEGSDETGIDSGNVSGSAAGLDGSGPARGPTPPANPDNLDTGSQGIPGTDTDMAPPVPATTPADPSDQVAETKVNDPTAGLNLPETKTLEVNGVTLPVSDGVNIAPGQIAPSLQKPIPPVTE